jgi:hypothetical protein
MCGCYPALSVCISDAHIRPIGAISDQILHDQRWWISTITSDRKSNEFPNTLVCPYVISDFHESFPMIFCYVPKVINIACFPSEIQQVWHPFYSRVELKAILITLRWPSTVQLVCCRPFSIRTLSSLFHNRGIRSTSTNASCTPRIYTHGYNPIDCSMCWCVILLKYTIFMID